MDSSRGLWGVAGLVLAAALTACGGGGDAPLSSAHAQQQAQVEVARLHFILRPNALGQWYVQSDVDHSPIGVSTQVEQGSDARGGFVRVFFDRDYTHAGVIVCTSDDDFGTIVTPHPNLGLNHSTVRVWAGGKIINPATVYSYVPVGAGNFWCQVTMVNKP